MPLIVINTKQRFVSSSLKVSSLVVQPNLVLRIPLLLFILPLIKQGYFFGGHPV